MQIEYSQPNVHGLFTVTYQYRVPPYQRGYAWETRNVDDFWNDVSTADDQGHFLGPIVLHDPGVGDVRDVIDGQQRLITLQMLIALMRDRYIELGNPARNSDDGPDGFATAPQSLIRQSGYQNRFLVQAGDSNNKILEDFILRRPDDTNRRRFSEKKHVDTLSKVERARNKDLADAWRRLASHLDSHLANDHDPLSSLAALEDRVVRRVSLVVLDLKDLNDAFLLFETLNDRGLRLSAADLLKSHLLSKFDTKHQGDKKALEVASDKWDAMVDTLGGGDISGFLRHYLLMRHERVRKADVFPIFKRDVGLMGPDKALGELVEMGSFYADFVHPPVDGTTISQQLQDLNGTGVDTHRVALLPAKKYLAQDRFSSFAKLAEVLSFRWVVTGGNAQILETTYEQAAKTIHQSEGEEIDSAESILKAKLPSDALFIRAFAAQSLGYEYVAAYALRRIERAIAPYEKTIQSPIAVHVEHIMPRTPTEFWRSRVAQDAAYDEIVKRWGNLTLLLQRLNASISNGDWSTKRGTAGSDGYSASAIKLTSDLLSSPDWNSEAIELRARWLGVVASRVWAVGSPSVASLPTLPQVLADPTLLDPWYLA